MTMMNMRTSHLVAIALAGSLPLGCASGDEDNRVRLHDRATVLVVEDGAEGGAQLREILVHDDGIHADEGHVRVIAPRMRFARSFQDFPGWEAQHIETLLRRGSGPMLGVSVEQTPDGLLVQEVHEDSLAEAAGVQAGDVLLRIGERKIDDVDDVRAGLSAVPPGHEARIAVIRADEGIVELTAPMPEREEGHGLWAAGSGGAFLGVELDDGLHEHAEEHEDGEGHEEAEADEEHEDGSARAEGPGVWIAGVVPDSAAWFAGLERGDRLLSVDGEEVSSSEALVEAVAAREPGQQVELRLLRDDVEQTVTVRLGRRHGGAFSPRGSPEVRWFGRSGDDARRHFNLLMRPGEDLHLELDGALDFQDLLHDLPLELHDGSHSVRVEIENDRMTVEQDGETSYYRKNEEGDWVPDTDSGTNGGPRPR